MKIKFTERYSFEMGKVGMVQGYAFAKGCIVEAEDISPNGWARVKNRYCGECFVPPGVFEIIEEPKERTYTEAEVKAIRAEWEQIVQRMEKEKTEAAIHSEWVRNKLGNSNNQLAAQKVETRNLKEEVRKTNEVADDNYELYLAASRKLNLLEPEIERIEAAVRRVVPETKEGYLAEHVEQIVNELLMVRQARQNGPKMMRDINAIIAEGERKGEAVFISTEDKHPEDQYAEQEAKIKSESWAGQMEKAFDAIGQDAAKSLDKFSDAMKRLNELNAAKAAGGQVYRDYIVEWAKRYVEQNKGNANFYQSPRTMRRVTCVTPASGGRKADVGRADCHPDNCFNAHIGRAIALMRSLGETVPPFLLEAPEPTEVRVGDKVELLRDIYKEFGDKIECRKGDKFAVKRWSLGVCFEDNECTDESVVAKNSKIIDDSREEN